MSVSTPVVWHASGELGERYDDLCLRMSGFMNAQRALSTCLASQTNTDSGAPHALLEIGLGTGITADGVLQETRSILTCVEPDEMMINRARKRLVNRWTKDRINFVNRDVLSFCRDADKGVWDAAYSAFTLHNLPASEQNRILAAVYPLLRNGGQLVLADYAVRSEDDRIPAFKSHVDEIFDILGPDNHVLALRGWIEHCFDDMHQDRVRSVDKIMEQLTAIGYKDCTYQFTGRLEAVFIACS